MSIIEWAQKQPEFTNVQQHFGEAVAAFIELTAAYAKQHPNEVKSIVAKYTIATVGEIAARKIDPTEAMVSTADQLLAAENMLAPEVITKLRKAATDDEGHIRNDITSRTVMRLAIAAEIAKAAAIKKGKKS